MTIREAKMFDINLSKREMGRYNPVSSLKCLIGLASD